MSTEINLQFDKNDMEHQRALTVLNAWQHQGYTAEQIVARALVSFAEGKEQSTHINILLANVREMLQQMREVLDEVRTLKLREAAGAPGYSEVSPVVPVVPDEDSLELSSMFVAALKKAARPGMRLEN
ncbi:MAG: hypothetical protein JXB30_00045 [Anaerolineae bacterium]|nr:hypothetical protein [Anaerolineae bacterium]